MMPTPTTSSSKGDGRPIRAVGAAAFGAALLAGTGTGLWPSAGAGAERFLELTDTYEPDPVHPAAYARRYELYREM